MFLHNGVLRTQRKMAAIAVCLSASFVFGGPVNPNATRDAKRLYAYLEQLANNSFNGVIVGQNCGHGTEIEIKYHDYIVEMHRRTGKWIGMVGVDYEYMKEYSPAELSRTNKYLIEHWRRGGLVTINFTPTNPFHSKGSVYNHNNVNLSKLLDQNSSAGRVWKAKLERIAKGLQELEDAGVVVLWRPMQEMNGAHFWYGKRQSEGDYQKLWRHMFNYFTNQKKLNNLLWVFSPLGGGDNYAYPGHDYVDIAAGTSYNNDLINWGYEKACTRYNGKPVGLAEYSMAVNKAYGNLDAKTYIRRIREKYPRVAYWVSWHSFGGSNRHALIHNKNYSALLNDGGVLTLDNLNWKASPAPSSPAQQPTSGDSGGNSDDERSTESANTGLGAPTNLQAEAKSETRIVLTWTDNAGSEEGCIIQSAESGGAYTEIGRAGNNAEWYTIVNLKPGTRYAFRVCAYAAGKRSGFSNVAEVETPGQAPSRFSEENQNSTPSQSETPSTPSAGDKMASSLGTPVNLTAKTASVTRIVLMWDDMANDEDGFYIERSVNGDNFVKYDHTGRNTARYNDIHLTSGEKYAYRVYAYKGNARSGYSNIASPGGSYGGSAPAPSAPKSNNPGSSDASTGDEIVRNSDFQAGVNNWKVYNFENAQTSQSVDDGVLRISVRSDGAEFWHIQLIQPGLRLKKGVRYEYTVRLRATQYRTVRMGVSRNSEPWNVYSGLKKVSIDNRWQTVTKVFTMQSDDANARFELDCGGEWGDIFIDQISLKPVRTGFGKINVLRKTSSLALAVSLYENSPVAIDMFDVSGRKVATIYEGALRAGTHVLPLSRRTLAPGNYLLAVRGKQTVITRRLVVGAL